jgi:hypothetical protein
VSVLWWKSFPGRLRKELESFRRPGVTYTVDHQRFKNGELAVDLTFAFEGGNYALQALYPDTFPYFEPTVLGFDLGFTLHWNPFEKNLCLIGRKTENWNPQYTVGDLIAEQFPKIILANTLPRTETTALEIDQGEPLSTFYPTEAGSLILIEGEWNIPADVSGGWLRLGLRPDKGQQKLFGAVLEVQDETHQSLCRLNESIAMHFGQAFWGRWQRLPNFIREDDTAKFNLALSSLNQRFRHLQWGYQRSFWLDVTAGIFPEEVRRCEYRDGWIFLCHRGDPPTKQVSLRKPRLTGQSFVRAERCGRQEVNSRIPELAFAATKTVAVVGLGCLGATLALELAKAGFALKLIDSDEVEFGPSVRWPLGFEYLGWKKGDALKSFIKQQWPFCTVEGLAWRIGAKRRSDEQILSSVDLIVDATAEIGVQRYLSDLAAELSKPMVLLSTTPGGWGGRFARFLPARRTEPCHACLCFYEAEGFITCPPADPNGTFQPVGCGDITFHAA